MAPNNAATDKAEEQRRAAAAAVEMLTEALGPDFPRWVDLCEAATFRFRPALMRQVEADKRRGRPDIG